VGLWQVGLLASGGVLLVAGCLWVSLWSGALTAIYSPEYTRQLLDRWPLLSGPFTVAPGDPGGMTMALEVGLLAMLVGYGLALVALGHPGDGGLGAAVPAIVLTITLVTRLTFFLQSGLYSTDVFSYIMYGRIASVLSGNPYFSPPAAFASDGFLAWVYPFWRQTPTVYGPIWTGLSGLLSTASGEWSNLDQTLLYRAVLSAVEVLTLVVLWSLLGSVQADAGERIQGFLLFAWNPVVLFDLAGSAHNDSLMVLLLLFGVMMMVRRKPAVGLLLLLLSSLVKYTTGVAVVLWTAAWAARAASLRGALARSIAAGLLSAGVVVAVSSPWLSMTEPSTAPAVQRSLDGMLVLNSAPDLLALTVADQILVPDGLDPAAAQAEARLWLRWVTRAVLVAVLLWQTQRVWRTRSGAAAETDRVTLQATALVLLLVPLLVLSWVWSWYFTWSLALAAGLGWRSWLARLIVLYSMVALPVVYAHQYLDDMLSGGFIVAMAVTPLVGWLAWRTAAQARSLPRNV
jgi:hypothetical protein